MKKTLLLFIIISSFLFGQEKIEGIGPYKIGKLTEKQLDSLMTKLSKKKILAIGDDEFLKASKIPNSYIKHLPNLKNLNDNVFTKYYLENISVYKIKNLTINGKYKIKDAELIFSDGILIFGIVK